MKKYCPECYSSMKKKELFLSTYWECDNCEGREAGYSGEEQMELELPCGYCGMEHHPAARCIHIKDYT